RRVQRRVAYLPAGERAALGGRVQQVRLHVVALGQMQLPDRPALARVRECEVDDHVHAPLEGAVDTLPRVGRDQQDAVVRLESLQQVVGLEVGVPVVGILYTG